MIMTINPGKYNALYSVPRLVLQRQMPSVPATFFDTVDRLARGEPAAAAAGGWPRDARELLRIAERLGSVQVAVPAPPMRHLLALLYREAFVVFTRE